MIEDDCRSMISGCPLVLDRQSFYSQTSYHSVQVDKVERAANSLYTA
jgi:hypothetical protein